ncbi:hypothetical protein EVA_18608 [gut metagenome]|uniref:Uncharacterized protein n=1 Tax=gut metagenome TaxID=749906 RepID=J9FFS0_9ZZZZ
MQRQPAEQRVSVGKAERQSLQVDAPPEGQRRGCRLCIRCRFRRFRFPVQPLFQGIEGMRRILQRRPVVQQRLGRGHQAEGRHRQDAAHHAQLLVLQSDEQSQSDEQRRFGQEARHQLVAFGAQAAVHDGVHAPVEAPQQGAEGIRHLQFGVAPETLGHGARLATARLHLLFARLLQAPARPAAVHRHQEGKGQSHQQGRQGFPDTQGADHQPDEDAVARHAEQRCQYRQAEHVALLGDRIAQLHAAFAAQEEQSAPVVADVEPSAQVAVDCQLEAALVLRQCRDGGILHRHERQCRRAQSQRLAASVGLHRRQQGRQQGRHAGKVEQGTHEDAPRHPGGFVPLGRGEEARDALQQ